MKTLKHIGFIIFFLQTISIFGQDPNFSNFNNNKIYYNPAYAGIDYGLRINLAYRRQWPNIPGKFQTFYACFDHSIRFTRGTGGGGFGLIAVSNTEGEGALQRITLGVPISVRLISRSKSLVQFSWMPAYSFNSINWDQFVFSGQLDPYYGNKYSSGFISPDEGTSNKTYADIGNFGIVYRYENTSSQANSSKFYKKFEVGIAGFHLTEPDQSFTHSKESPLPAKWVFLTNYTTSISLNHDGYLLLEPSLLCEWQWKMFSYMMGVNASLTDFNIDLGVWWRSKNINPRSTDAIIALFGYRFLLDKSKNIILTASLAYDFTISKLTDVTRGSPEITISIAFNESSFFNDRPDVCDEGAPWMNRKKLSVRKRNH